MVFTLYKDTYYEEKQKNVTIAGSFAPYTAGDAGAGGRIA
jgi:hypothetical protein